MRVSFAGQVTADSMRALTLKEASYHSVNYIPRTDLGMSPLPRTDGAGHHTVMAEIKEHFAFCPGRVDAIEEG